MKELCLIRHVLQYWVSLNSISELPRVAPLAICALVSAFLQRSSAIGRSYAENHVTPNNQMCRVHNGNTSDRNRGGKVPWFGPRGSVSAVVEVGSPVSAGNFAWHRTLTRQAGRSDARTDCFGRDRLSGGRRRRAGADHRVEVEQRDGGGVREQRR